MNNGGPAFPVPIELSVLAELRRMGRQDVIKDLCSGLTKRDFFASAALQGRLANGQLLRTMEAAGVPSDRIPEAMAKHSYAFADAMLAERAKSTEEGA